MDKILAALIIGLLVMIGVILAVYGYFGGQEHTGVNNTVSTSSTTGKSTTLSQPGTSFPTNTSTTAIERIEIVSAYATLEDNNFTIHLTIRNTGTVATTIQDILINGQPHDKVKGWLGISPSNAFGKTIKPGEKFEMEIKLSRETFSSGQTIEIIIHTASGRNYPKALTLP